MANEMALTTYEEVSKIGAAMVKSGFFKSATNEAQAIVQIWAGREMGIGAVESLRGIHIIDGHISLSAGLVAAQVKRSGRYNYRVKVQTAVACEIEWYEERQPVGVSAFTIQEAAAAGLATKQVWKAYPSDMLFARALTRGARRFCPDVFGGSVYTSEELGSADAIEGDYEVQADTEPVASAASMSTRDSLTKVASGGAETLPHRGTDHRQADHGATHPRGGGDRGRAGGAD